MVERVWDGFPRRWNDRVIASHWPAALFPTPGALSQGEALVSTGLGWRRGFWPCDVRDGDDVPGPAAWILDRCRFWSQYPRVLAQSVAEPRGRNRVMDWCLVLFLGRLCYALLICEIRGAHSW